MDVAKCLPDMSYGKILLHLFYGYLLDSVLRSNAILIRVASKIVRRDSAIHKLLLVGYSLSSTAFDLSHQKFLFSREVFVEMVILMFLQSCYLYGLCPALSLAHSI